MFLHENSVVVLNVELVIVGVGYEKTFSIRIPNL